MKRILIRIFVLNAFAVSSLLVNGQATNSNKATEQKSFNLNPDNLRALQNSVNLITGQLSFPISVASIPGRGGMNLSATFQYNTTGTQRAVKTKNIYSPTGVLGLGWSMDQSRIVVDNKQTGTRHDDDFFFVEGGVSNQLICTSHTSSLSKYATKNFSSWSIEYYPGEEKWIVKREDGSKYVYGDENSGRSTVQWMVKWGNWIGNSTQPENQEQTGYIWNLSEIENMWSDKIVFDYEAVTEFVAADAGNITTERQHTKASYLKKITDPIGQSIEFVYAEKGVDEYADPHVEKTEPDAYQEKYETRYLDKILAKNNNGTLLYSVELAYQTMDTGEFTKRFLTQVQKRFPNDETQPATQFEYFDSGESKGYLKKVLNSLGAHVDYYYETMTVANSDRSISQVGPSGYGQPKVYLENNYAVITWRKLKADEVTVDAGKQPVKIFVYYWDGRWIGEELWQTPAINNTDYSRISIATAEKHFIYRIYEAQFNTQQIYIARKKTLYTGANQWTTLHWAHGAGGSDPNLTGRVMAGENYVAYCMRSLAEIRTVVWKDEQWVEHRLPINDGATELYCTGGLNYMLIHNDKGGAFDVLHMFYLNEEHHWQQYTLPSSVSFDSDNGAYDYPSYWHAANSFLVALPQYNPEYIYVWDEEYQNFSKQNILGQWEDDAFVFTQNNSQFAISQVGGKGISARYDGMNWILKGPYTNYFYTDISFGEDFFIRDLHQGKNPREVYLSVFNSNTGNWEPDIQYLDNRIGALNKNYNIIIKAGINMFSFKDGVLYNRSSDGGWNYTDQLYLQRPPLTEVEYVLGSSVFLMTPNFIVYEYSTLLTGESKGIYIAYLENDKIKSYSKYPAHILNQSASNVSPNTVATQFGSNAIILKRIVDGASSGNLTTHIVRNVVWSDGNNIFETLYQYQNGKASPDGQMAQFNKVTAIPGSNSLSSTPFGKTDYFFYNGLPESQLVTPPATSNGGYEILLAGAPYKTDVSNASSALISSSKNTYQVFTRPIQNTSNEVIASSHYVRAIKSERSMDGIQSISETTYDETTGFARQTKQFNSKGIGQNAEEITTTLKYWWEAYDPTRVKNILSPVIASVMKRNGQPIRASAVKWKIHSSVNKYFPEETYAWLKTGSEDFVAWNNADVPSSDWLQTGVVTKLDEVDGTVFETKGQDETISASIYDVTHTRVVASATYATYDQIAYTSFEDLSSGNWQYDASLFTTADARTGSQCFVSLPLSDPDFNFITKALTEGEYEVSYWMKVTSSAIEVINGTVTGSSVIEVQDGWSLVKGIISIAAGNGTVKIKVPVNGLVDEVRVKPKNAKMTTAVYDGNGNLITQSDTNLVLKHYEYDGQYRPVVVRDHKNQILKKNTYHFRNQ